MLSPPTPDRCTFGSLTRIADLDDRPFGLEPRSFAEWETGDYVVGVVTDASGYHTIELPTGRHMEVPEGDVEERTITPYHALSSLKGAVPN